MRHYQLRLPFPLCPMLQTNFRETAEQLVSRVLKVDCDVVVDKDQVLAEGGNFVKSSENV